MAGHFSIKAVDRAHQNDLKQRKEEEESLIRSCLCSIQDEIQTVWDRYMSEIGRPVERLADREPFLQRHPITQNYFNIYDGSTSLIGKIKDAELRRLIVTTYLNLKGLVDVYKHGDSVIEIYEKFRFKTDQESKAQAESALNTLKEEIRHIKAQHFFVKEHVEKLLVALQKAH